MATATKNRASARDRIRVIPTQVSPWQQPPTGDLTVVDMFCGAGGSSLGLTHAGFDLRLGINHWRRAIETHATNFRRADHWCADVNAIEMRRVPKADLLWASPICTEMSPAGGKAKVRQERVAPAAKNRKAGQGDVLEEAGYIEPEGYEKTRATHWNVIEYVEAHHPPAFITENVAELAETWVLFTIWLSALAKLGYRIQVVSLNSAHVGDETNPHAPQWRDRIYCVGTRMDVPKPDLELRPIALCITCGDNVRGVQTWAKATLKRVASAGQVLVGRYRRDPRSSYGQYWYTCPKASCKGARVEPYVRPAASAIDWADLGGLIGERTGDDMLVENTRARIRAGIVKFGRPIHVTAAGNTFERPGYTRAWPADATPLNTAQCTDTTAVVAPPFRVNTNHDDTRVATLHGQPLPAGTTKIGDGVVVPPMGVPCGGTWADDPIDLVGGPMRAQLATDKGCEGVVIPPDAFLTVLRTNATASSVQEPTQTVMTGNHQYVTVPPFYTMHYSPTGGTQDPGRMSRSITEPLGAMSTTNSHSLVTGPDQAALDAFYVMNYGGHTLPHQTVRSVGSDPFGPMTTRDSHALVVPYYSKGVATSTESPLDAVTTHDRFSLVNTPDGWLADVDLDLLVDMCRFRMLKPQESLAAQRFDADYLVTGNLGERTMQAGNAVSCNAAQFLGQRVAAVLARTSATI